MNYLDILRVIGWGSLTAASVGFVHLHLTESYRREQFRQFYNTERAGQMSRDISRHLEVERDIKEHFKSLKEQQEMELRKSMI